MKTQMPVSRFELKFSVKYSICCKGNWEYIKYNRGEEVRKTGVGKGKLTLMHNWNSLALEL